MSLRTPHSLQHLAMQHLLSNQFLAITALEDLPRLLFPSLLLEAYSRGHIQLLKAMVQDWPFPCLILGDLAKSPDLDTFKAVLDGLDLLVKKERPSRWKLRVLDLRNEHLEMWTRGYHNMAQSSYPDILIVRTTANHYSAITEEQPLMIIVDLTIKNGTHDDFQIYLLQWAKQRKERIQLYSKKLQIMPDSISEINNTLHLLKLDFIHELKVSHFCQPETLITFAPYLGQMKNLHILNFCNVCGSSFTSIPDNVCYSYQLGEHLGKLQHLQEIHMHKVFFHRGQLPNIFRNLAPLKTLSLTLCVMEETDLWILSQSPCIRQLKNLQLRTLFMGRLKIEPLRAILEQVASSLEALALEKFFIRDAHVPAILPALSQCTQLKFFSFYGNCISIDTLLNLLSHMASLGHLRQGLYPAPVESYQQENWLVGIIHTERFAHVLTDLAQALRDMGATQKVQICTNITCLHTNLECYTVGPDGSWVVTEEVPPVLSALPM
ncbi:PRAME family member 12-like [Thomomys bottae]